MTLMIFTLPTVRAGLNALFPKSVKTRMFAKAGFTILEMLIAIVLLVVGIVATLNMFAIAMRADANVEQSTIALSLAQEEIELIKNTSSWDGIDAFASARTNLGGDFADFDKEVVVMGDPKKVQVIIYWDARGLDQTVELATLFTNYNY